MKQQKVLIIVGPTSSGKSALAVELARKFNGEVVSADSRQVYRGLDIGTGKITRREMRGVPHHLLDVASPKCIFTAHDFVQQGRGGG
jgi:tRNA dimethylallyltransferase